MILTFYFPQFPTLFLLRRVSFYRNTEGIKHAAWNSLALAKFLCLLLSLDLSWTVFESPQAESVILVIVNSSCQRFLPWFTRFADSERRQFCKWWSNRLKVEKNDECTGVFLITHDNFLFPPVFHILLVETPHPGSTLSDRRWVQVPWATAVDWAAKAWAATACVTTTWKVFVALADGFVVNLSCGEVSVSDFFLDLPPLQNKNSRQVSVSQHLKESRRVFKWPGTHI